MSASCFHEAMVCFSRIFSFERTKSGLTSEIVKVETPQNWLPPTRAENMSTGHQIHISADGKTSIEDLIGQIASNDSTPVGEISLFIGGEVVDQSQSDRVLDDFDLGKEGIVYFKVDMDHDSAYGTACKLVHELEELLAPFKPGFLHAAYGYPMFGKYDKNGTPNPGAVVSVREYQARKVEEEIRMHYPTMFANRIPIYIDEWDNES